MRMVTPMLEGYAYFSSLKLNIVLDVKRDNNGRFLAIKIKSGDHEILVCNICAPNDDCPKFFQKIFEITEGFVCEKMVIGGGLNVALDQDQDKRRIIHINWEAVEQIKLAMENMTLVDIWRLQNPDKFMFKWQRACREYTSTPSLARLDYFLIPVGLIIWVEVSKILPGFRSDH